MAIVQKQPPSPPRADDLEGHHERLERLTSQVLLAVYASDWTACDVAWRHFRRGLERHMRFEEEVLFPGFAATSPEAGRLVQLLRAEHTMFRHQTEQLQLDVQLHVMRAAQVEAFLEGLRDHSKREERTLYRFWREGSPPAFSVLPRRR